MAARVVGSEKFHFRLKSNEEIQRKLPPKLQLFTEMRREKLDPVTYEVIRHSIWQITNEMGETIKRASGSIVVTDANDFNFAIANEFGDQVQTGVFNTQLSTSMDMAIKWTLENRADSPGISNGDMFLCNDPWVGGGVHQNDVSLYAPFFWEGKLFAWTAAVAHQIDLGGVEPSSWTPRSENIFWESLPIPPVKMVEGGEIRKDTEDMYIRRSRLPDMVALDLRAKIAANNVGQEGLLRLIKKYGADVVKRAMEEVMDHAELSLRQRLSTLPDGTWRGVGYQETAKFDDKGVYKIALALTKTGDHLTFDFTGTSKQAVGMINCTMAGLRGGIMSSLLPELCADIPWSIGGITRCIDIISEEGTLNNCTFPAGICKASIASSWATKNVATECISNMLGASKDRAIRSRRIAVSCGSFDLVVISGLDQRKEPFIGLLQDAVASGTGARSDSDGVDTGGSLGNMRGQIPDVETTEFNYPVLYLWRNEATDSGGAGKFRGGLSCAYCVIPYKTDKLTLIVSNSGTALPQASGLDGGFPGATITNVIIKDSKIADLLARGLVPSSLDEIEGTKMVLGPAYQGDMGPPDIFYSNTQGGGGIGDPLLRDPEAVLKDVLAGKVSRKAAKEIYCVAIGNEKEVGVDNAGAEAVGEILNREATQRLRSERLASRRGTTTGSVMH